MKLYGLMITKDDHDVIGDWCKDQLSLYDAVVCLDGSESDATRQIVRPFGERLIYLHECCFDIPHKTDHGLRRPAHQEIVRWFGVDNWVMCCHADEFCYHDPRLIAERAEEQDCDQVSWFSLHFFPHPTELADWPTRRKLPITQRFRHYHWDHLGSGLPWIEDRLYKNGPSVEWDQTTHGSVRPHGLRRPAPFQPILRHYKVISTDPAHYEPSGFSTLYRTHWQTQEHRTGLPFRVARLEDLFVSWIPHYAQCDRLDGIIDQPWNMGEQYRPGAKRPGRLVRESSRREVAIGSNGSKEATT